LGLLSGARADKSLIRQGAERCEVEGVLHFADTTIVDRALESLGLPPCDEGALVLSRTVEKTRAAKVRINGQLTTAGNLQALGESWIDFHGPGEPQKLFQERWQLELIDLYAKNASRLATYRKGFQRWKELLAERDRLANTSQLAPDEREFLQIQ